MFQPSHGCKLGVVTEKKRSWIQSRASALSSKRRLLKLLMHLIKMPPGHLFLEMFRHGLLGEAPELTGGIMHLIRPGIALRSPRRSEKVLLVIGTFKIMSLICCHPDLIPDKRRTAPLDPWGASISGALMRTQCGCVI